jgi:hypothetical protein
MIKSEKELLKALRCYLKGNIEIKKFDNSNKIHVNYEKSYILFSVLILLKEKNRIKEFTWSTNGWFVVNISEHNGIKKQYQYANCTLVYDHSISYNEIFENVLHNKHLHANMTNTTNVTSMCLTKNNKIVITFSVYGYFNFDNNGECVYYNISNIDDDLYIFNSYDEFKQENSEIINILINKGGSELCTK